MNATVKIVASSPSTSPTVIASLLTIVLATAPPVSAQGLITPFSR